MAGLDYFGECCDKFLKMPMRAEINLETQVRPENRKIFRDCVELFIDFDYGRKDGFYLQPTNDWQRIIKTPY